MFKVRNFNNDLTTTPKVFVMY